MPGSWWDLLRCPSCAGEFTAAWIPTPPGGRGHWGRLRCACGEHPVVDDVPILKADRVDTMGDTVDEVAAPGPTRQEVLEALDGPDPLSALLGLLVLPAGVWPVTRAERGRRLLAGRPVGPTTTALRARRARRLLRGRDDTTAQDWLVFLLLDANLGGDIYNHAFLRFSQPRHLAALAVMAALPDGLVVDAACGFGHNAHYLTATGRRLIGIDHNYAHLWLARWWIAPRGSFACADLSRGLPMADAVADAAICADALHYFREPQDLVAEMRRVAPRGPLGLLRFGNADGGVAEGFERSAAAWVDLLGAAGAVRCADEAALVDDYMAGRTGRLDPGVATMATAPWLTAVVSPEGRPWGGTAELGWPPPHLRGEVGLNPIMVADREAPHVLRRRFPSGWYEHENGQMARWLPDRVRIDGEQRAALAAGDSGAACLRELIDRHVVIGLPRRYVTTLRRPRREALTRAARTARDRIGRLVG